MKQFNLKRVKQNFFKGYSTYFAYILQLPQPVFFHSENLTQPSVQQGEPALVIFP